MRNRDGAVALCLAALLFSVYLLTFSGIYHSSDEISMLAVTDSLARRGEWDIELLRWMGEQQGSFGADGHLYSRKGLGTTLAALPFYWLALQAVRLGNVQAAMLTNGLLTALTGVLVYYLLRRLRYSHGVSIGTALAFGLATMAWPYARYLFSETLAGLGLMICTYFLVSYGTLAQLDQPGQKAGNWAYPLLAGAGLSVALLSRLNNIIVAPFLGLLLLYYLYRTYGSEWRRWLKPIVLFALPVVAVLAVTGWYNWFRFGSPLATGYLPEENFATPFLEGFYGLLFSPGKGLFWYNPLLLVALIAWPTFFRQHKAEALLVAAVVVSNVAFYAPWYLWWAGHSWGPRFLVTILPFAVLPLAPALEAAVRHRAIAIGIVVLATLSILVQLIGVAVDHNLYLEEIYAQLGLYHPDTLFKPAYSPLFRQAAHIRLETLDLAWARRGTINWPALLTSLGLVLISAVALWVTWRKKLRTAALAALPLLLILVTVRVLVRYAPTGDMAELSRDLAAMEAVDEAAALTNPLYTESFQDAYDGRLWVWGVSSKEEVAAEYGSIWAIGESDPDPAAGRFQSGAVRSDLYMPPGRVFDIARLPIEARAEKAALEEIIQLTAQRFGPPGGSQGNPIAHPGDSLPLTLYWQALSPIDSAYTVFVQAIDTDGTKIAQLDRTPCHGSCPTDTWRPGDTIGERYDLLISDSAPPGRYQIITGMYNLETGQNLTWADAQGNNLGPHLTVGQLDVQP